MSTGQIIMLCFTLITGFITFYVLFKTTKPIKFLR